AQGPLRDLAAHVSDIHSLLGGKGLDLLKAFDTLFKTPLRACVDKASVFINQPNRQRLFQTLALIVCHS
ncbi:MAG: hypothetical protein IK094_08740, partial [Treponema sp.]|nr:hypothetical protein [Treponema sp.]